MYFIIIHVNLVQNNANTSPRHMAVLGNVHTIKLKSEGTLVNMSKTNLKMLEIDLA